jgi:DNA-3-methyladenine glycosylase II
VILPKKPLQNSKRNNHITTFNKDNFRSLCDIVSSKDPDIKAIVTNHGYPPMWRRPAGFPTLLRIILEQQVSLSSAKAAYNKLKEKAGIITPAKISAFSDEELKACYFSRQKALYARELASVILSRKMDLKKIGFYSDEEVKNSLKQVKGIGDWTADVYLMFALRRTDVFPIGDLAMVNAFREIKQLPGNTTKEKILAAAESWRPHRSIASMFLWHYYIQTR